MTLIAYVFENCTLWKTCFEKCLKSLASEDPSISKGHGKRSQTLLKCEGQHLYYNHWWMWRQLSWKNSSIVICKILGLFVNTLTANDKYSLLNTHSLTQHNHMQISNKQKPFSQSFSAFLKARLSFEHFETKMTLTVYVFVEIRTPKDVVR